MRINWNIPPVSNDFRNTVHQSSNLVPLFHFVLRMILHVCVILFLIYSLKNNHLILSFLLIFLNGLLTTFMGWAGAGHEYFHSTAFSSGRLNKILFRFFSCATWNNWGWFEVSHLLHHKYTLHLSDPEKPAKHSMTLTRILFLISIDFPVMFKRLRILFSNCLGTVPTNSIAIKQIIDTKPNLAKRVRLGALSVFAYQFSVFLFLTAISFELAVIVFFAPFTFTFINKIVEIVQHVSMTEHSFDFRDNSRTVRFNRFLEFLYANMNFHAEHHMYPGTPYYNLPALHNKLLTDGVTATPQKGLWLASKIVFRSQVNTVSENDCISCYADCPIKNSDISDD